MACCEEEDDDRHDSCRQYNKEVLLEFIVHLAALCPYSRDRRIGNKGEVVSKHGAAYNSSNTDRNREAGLL